MIITVKCYPTLPSILHSLQDGLHAQCHGRVIIMINIDNYFIYCSIITSVLNSVFHWGFIMMLCR